MGLSPDRARMTTASRAPLIVNGKPGEVYDYYLERRGEKEPESFDYNLAVHMGRHMGPFFLDWLELTEQHPITERERWCPHPTLPWLGATIDGYRAHDDAVIETKFPGPWQKHDELCRWYAPQVVVQMLCRPAARGFLVLPQGNERLVQYEITVDDAYRTELHDRLHRFQLCVTRGEPPSPPPAPLVPPEQWRTVDLLERPMANWGHAMVPTLSLWASTLEAARMHARTKEDVKALLPDDVGLCTFGPIKVKRNRAGAVSIIDESEP
jgi:hypothetical protein